MPFIIDTPYTTNGGFEAVIDAIKPTHDYDGASFPTTYALQGRVRETPATPWRFCCWTLDGRWRVDGPSYHLDLVSP